MEKLGRYEDLEVLVRHTDIVIGRMERIKCFSAKGTYLYSVFLQPSVQEWLKSFEDIAIAIKLRQSPSFPPAQRDIQQAMIELESCIKEPTQSVLYIAKWITMVRTQLIYYINNISYMNIRWNQMITLDICKIFTTFCRVVLFFQALPQIRLIIYAAFNNKLLENEADIKCIYELIMFIYEISENPIIYINCTMGYVSDSLKNMFSYISTYLSDLFSLHPKIDWSIFSIYHISNENVTSTLVSDEYFILQNISLIQETFFFFLSIFPECITSNPQYNIFLTNILSETPIVSLSPTSRIAFERYMYFVNPNYISKSNIEQIENLQKEKLAPSHLQRMVFVDTLLQEIINICEYDDNQLSPALEKIIALISLAYYEINVYLMYDEQKIEFLELLNSIMKIRKLIIDCQDKIQRFYVFNLATIDLTYLELKNECISKSTQFSLAFNFFAENMQILDLNDFDSGARYNFSPFFVTYGRTLLKYNQSKNSNPFCFYNDFFEHLTTIIHHMSYAQDPIQVFTERCPIHQLWAYTKKYDQHVNNEDLPINLMINLIKLFNTFNEDRFILMQDRDEIELQVSRYAMIRASIFKRIQTSLISQCSDDSSFIKVIDQTQLSSLYDKTNNSDDFIIPKGFIPTKFQSFSKNIHLTVDLYESINQLPEKVMLFHTQPDDAKALFADKLIKNLAFYIIQENAPPPLRIDKAFSATYQVYWKIFHNLGISFNRVFTEMRFNEGSTNDGTRLLNQVRYLDGTFDKNKGEQCTNESISNVKRLVAYSKLVNKFINEDFQNTLYLPELYGFYSLPQFTEYKANTFFSSTAFYYLIKNHGLQCGVQIDRVLIEHIVRSVEFIFQKYSDISIQLSNWYDLHVKTNFLFIPTNFGDDEIHFDETLEEMIKLGTTLTLRKLLRQQMKKVANEGCPGISQLIEGGFSSTSKARVTTESEKLLMEVFSGEETYHFILRHLTSRNSQQQTDIVKFFFFLSLILNNSAFESLKFYKQFKAMKRNIHLFPVAFDLLINTFPVFFTSNDENSIKKGMDLFFKNFRSIVINKKRLVSPEVSNSMIELAKIFPFHVKNLEYGRIEEAFSTQTDYFADSYE